MRLRSDILWAAKRWKDAAAADRVALWRSLEGLHAAHRRRALRHPARGDRLCAGRRGDRAGELPREIRGENGGHRRRPRFRRGERADRPPAGEFRDVAKTIAAVDTLDAFLRDMRARYPDSSALSAAAAGVEDAAPIPPAAKPATPQAVNRRRRHRVRRREQAAANAPVKPGKPDAASSPLPPKVPAGVPLKPDPAPTGSIPTR